MGIISTLYNGVSGMGRMGDNMQIIADNVSNVNSVAYKARKVQFNDILTSAENNLFNGNGVGLMDINTNNANGGIKTTHISTDLAISGTGYFLFRDTQNTTADIYSRAGQFKLKEDSTNTNIMTLVNESGLFAQGYNLSSVDTQTDTLADILVRKTSLPNATTSIRLAANIEHDLKKSDLDTATLYDSWDGTKTNDKNEPEPIADDAFDYKSAMNIFDSDGNSQSLSMYFDHTSNPTEKEFLITCDPSKDKRLIDTTTRFDSATDKGAGALLYGIMTFSNTGELDDIKSWNVPADANVGDVTNIERARGVSDFSFEYNFNGTGSNTSSTINFGTIVLPQTITSPALALSNKQPFTQENPAQNITKDTLFSSAYDINGEVVKNGDVIAFEGTNGEGTAVSYSYTVDTTKSVNDLLQNLSTQFSATVDILDGKLQIQDSLVGPSQLDISSITHKDSIGTVATADNGIAQLFGTNNDSFDTTWQPKIISSSGSAKITSPPDTPIYINSQSLFDSVYDTAGTQTVNGDVITFTGKNGSGTDVTYAYTVDTTKTVSDLLQNLETAFDASADIQEGKIRLRDNDTQALGTSQLGITSIGYTSLSNNPPAQIFGNEGNAFHTEENQRFMIDQPATTSYALYSATTHSQQNGYGTGLLADVSVDLKGVIYGEYSNGQKIAQAQVALTRFTSLDGLRVKGDGDFSKTDSVGLFYVSPKIKDPGVVLTEDEQKYLASFGQIVGNSLEMSNVDLGVEFASLISTQRAYQANSRSITTADEVIEAVLNIKR